MDKKAEALLERITDLENAAKRGLQINKEIPASIDQGKVISVEHCNVTLKNCALFRKWVNEYLGS